MKAVIFDMNGVIVNDERIHQQAWREFYKNHNFQLTEEEFKYKVFGRTEKEIFEFLFKRKLTEGEIDKYSNERVQVAIDIFKPNLAPTKGLMNFLNDLESQDITMAIATSSRWPYINFILDGLNIRKFFIVIITAEDITKGKPDPQIYLLTAKQIGVNPQDCVVFEDTISGIKSAHSAGMKVIAITTTHQTEELDMADRIIDSFNQISIEDIKNL